MKAPFIVISLVAAAVLSGCGAVSDAVHGSRAVPGARPLTLSLFPILADPEKFHGREIELEAFVASREGSCVLAPTLSCIGNLVGPSLVNLDVEACRGCERLKDLNPGVCYLVGIVDARDHGPLTPKAFTFRAKECKNAFPARVAEIK